MNIKALKTTIMTIIIVLTTSVTALASSQTIQRNETNGYTFYIHDSVENPTQATVDTVIKNNIMVQGQIYIIYLDNETGRTNLKSLLPDIQLLGQPRNSIHRQALTAEQGTALGKIAVPMDKVALASQAQITKTATNQLSSEEVAEKKVTFYTNEHLTEMAKNAPTPVKTKSAIKMTNNRMTETQLKTWIAEYTELGGANAFELEVVRLINIERAKEGLEPLAISQPLMLAARFKSQEMVDLEYFSHISPVYNVKGDYIGLPGLLGWDKASGENLQSGSLTPERVLERWMNSPGHKQPIMNPQTKSIGIGRVSSITTANFGY